MPNYLMEEGMSINKPVHLLAVIGTITLAACGGSGGGSGSNNANGLLDEAQNCAYLLVDTPADEINTFGCVYFDENNQLTYWPGTNGGQAPQTLDDQIPQTQTPVDTTGNTSTGDSIVPNDDNTGSNTTAGSSIVFPETQAFSAEFADNGRGNVYSSAINSAILSGPVVGTASFANADLYKSVPFIAEGFSTGFELLHVLAHDVGYSSRSAALTMHLQNTSFDIQCFVKHGEISVYNANGTVVSEGLLSFGFADGSLGVTPSGIYTDTCIAPGEIVYITDLLGTDITLDQVAGVKVQDLTASTAGSTAQLSVKPISYQVTDNTIEVIIANQSPEAVNLGSSRLVVLTDNGVPIYNDLELHNDDLLPGSELTLSYPNRFAGKATTIRVLLDYDPIN